MRLSRAFGENIYLNSYTLLDLGYIFLKCFHLTLSTNGDTANRGCERQQKTFDKYVRSKRKTKETVDPFWKIESNLIMAMQRKLKYFMPF